MTTHHHGERQVKVLPPTLYTMSGLSNGSSLTIPIAQRILTCGAPEAVLVARLGTGTSMVAGQSVNVALLIDAFTIYDPVTQFRTALNTNSGVTFTAGSFTAPAMQYAATSVEVGAGSSFGYALAINFTATQAGGGGAFLFVLSVDLILKGVRGPGSHEMGLQFGGY